MLTISKSSLRRWLLPLSLLLLFLPPLVFLNRKFFDAAEKIDKILDSFTIAGMNWAQNKHFFGSIDEGQYHEYYQSLGDLEDWLTSPEMIRVKDFTGLGSLCNRLQSNLEIMRARNLDRRAVVDSDLLSVNLVLRTFRNRLNDVIAFLFSAQILLIVLLMLLIMIALEDRNRQKYEIDSSRRIQIEITRAQEEERNRIALDLHDDIAQELSWIRMGLFNMNVEKDKIAVVDKLIYKVRELSMSLRTPDFTTELFDDAVRDLIENAGQHSDVTVKYIPGHISPDKQPEIYGHIYRIMQECLNNAVKHSGGCKAYIELQEEDGFLFYEYRDNGAGFNPAEEPGEKRLGFSGIRNRVLMMNGKLDIKSETGRGMSLKCRLPLKGVRT